MLRRSERIIKALWSSIAAIAVLVLPTLQSAHAQAGGQSAVNVPTISAGYSHTCGLRDDGTVACWGDNAYGQITPLAGTFIQVSGGESSSCGIRPDGIPVGSRATAR